MRSSDWSSDVCSADLDGPLTRRIGQVDAQADARLRAHGCRRHWFIVTPCNPRSQAQSDTYNEARLRAMRQQLRESACRYVETLACANDRTWSEAGFCIFDLAEADARMLGRAYEQNAIVGAALDSAPHLLWPHAGTGAHRGRPEKRREGERWVS